MRNNLVLLFKDLGAVQLVDESSALVNNPVVWSSDTDLAFRDEFGDELLTPDDDAEDILAWLVDHGKLTDEEADDIDIFQEDETEEPEEGDEP